MYNNASSRRLDVGWPQQDGVRPVEVGVHHERRATAQVHVFLPPIRHVVTGPPLHNILDFYIVLL